MSLINTGSFSKALWPGVNRWYGKSYNDYGTEYDKIFDVRKSNRNFEEDVGISSFGLAIQKPEGAPIQYDSERQGFISRYQHVVFALGFIITREVMDDDLYDIVGQRKAQGLARSIRQTKEIFAANVYNRAFNGAYVGGNGVSMINAAQVNVKGGTFSNTLATAADLSEAAVEQAWIDIGGFTDDAGLLIAARPKTLVIPRQLEFEAERIFKSDLRVGTNNNDINAIKSMGRGFNIVVNHYLTDPDAWFLLTDVPNGPTFFERRPDEFAMENDFDTENAKFKATSRYSVGWSDPRGVYGSPGA
jgi:hypothetical protein